MLKVRNAQAVSAVFAALMMISNAAYAVGTSERFDGEKTAISNTRELKYPEEETIYAASSSLVVYANGSGTRYAAKLNHVIRKGATLTLVDDSGNKTHVTYVTKISAAMDQRSMEAGDSIDVTRCLKEGEVLSTTETESGTIERIALYAECGMTDSVSLTSSGDRDALSDFTMVDITQNELFRDVEHLSFGKLIGNISEPKNKM